MTDIAAATPHKVRPFLWSIRRELWENRAVYLAPAIVSAVVLVAFLFSLLFSGHSLPNLVRAAATDPRAAASLNMPYAAAAAASFMISFFVAVFYSLGALHGERRDRSLLFWKSLPVSDRTAVLAKAAIPLLVQPVVVLVVAFATQLAILVVSSVVVAANGIAPTQLWSHLHLGMFWVMIPYGLLVNALWDVPFYAWLLLVSAWAKRMTFVWAVAPWLAAALFEFLAFRTRYVVALLQSRVFGGFNQAYTVEGKGGRTIESLSQVDPLRVFTHPDLWLGLLLGALLLAACVWLRRRSEPI